MSQGFEVSYIHESLRLLSTLLISAVYTQWISQAFILLIYSYSLYRYQFVSGTGGKSSIIFIEALIVEELDMGYKIPLVSSGGQSISNYFSSGDFDWSSDGP